MLGVVHSITERDQLGTRSLTHAQVTREENWFERFPQVSLHQGFWSSRHHTNISTSFTLRTAHVRHALLRTRHTCRLKLFLESKRLHYVCLCCLFQASSQSCLASAKCYLSKGVPSTNQAFMTSSLSRPSLYAGIECSPSCCLIHVYIYIYIYYTCSVLVPSTNTIQLLLFLQSFRIMTLQSIDLLCE